MLGIGLGIKKQFLFIPVFVLNQQSTVQPVQSKSQTINSQWVCYF